VSELLVQIASLLRRYDKELERIIHEKTEDEVQKHKRWIKGRAGGVAVIAKKNGKFVLVKNTPESWEEYHNYWGFPGGKVEHGEGFEEAAVREFREETGLSVGISNLVSVHEHIIRSPQGNQQVWYVAIFEGKVVGGEMNTQKPDEIAQVKLFDELPQKELIPWLQDPYLMF